MKKIIAICIIGIAAFFGPKAYAADPPMFDQLLELIEQQNYFKLKTDFDHFNIELSDSERLFTEAIIYNVFNKAERSNENIEKLLRQPQQTLNDSLIYKLYLTKQLNHINLYEYGLAADCSAILLSVYEAFLDATEKERQENEMKIWMALKNAPKQEVIRNSDATIPMHRDKVGLYNVHIETGDSTYQLLFDTGANFSVVTETTAKKMGIEIYEADFYVTAATGAKVKSKVGIAEKINLGGILIKHAVFLILDDEFLSFPQIDYYPNGAIGFPIIEALEEIRISKNDQIFVPKTPVQYDYDNLALDGLMPIVAGTYRGDTLRFNFDTGATNTSLYSLFFLDYEEEIKSKYQKEIFHAGSAGGTMEFEGYIIDSFDFNIAESKATITNLHLYQEEIGDEESNFHGNFGQDYIKQFDELIISFKYSSLSFK